MRFEKFVLAATEMKSFSLVVISAQPPLSVVAVKLDIDFVACGKERTVNFLSVDYRRNITARLFECNNWRVKFRVNDVIFNPA